MYMVTLSELIDDINRSSSDKEYMFLRVLSSSDRALWLSKLNPCYYDVVYMTKKVSLNIWVNILKTIPVSVEYTVYRRAYEGENRGVSIITTVPSTRYLVPIWRFSPSESTPHLFTRAVHSCLGSSRKQGVHILIDAWTMSVIEMGHPYQCSAWENPRYKMDELWGLY